MSIQTELTRLTNAKAAIKAAIEGKGVTVPSGAKLDALAALIESIEAGGGGGNFATGTITVAERTKASSVVVNHNMDVVPNRLLWFITSPTVNKLSEAFALLALYCDEFCSVTVGNSSSSTSTTMNYKIAQYGISHIGKTETDIHLSDGGWIHGGYIPAGYTVTWFVWG